MKIETSDKATKIDFDSYETQTGSIKLGDKTFEANEVVGIDND